MHGLEDSHESPVVNMGEPTIDNDLKDDAVDLITGADTKDHDQDLKDE